jgi:hypothetical protein
MEAWVGGLIAATIAWTSIIVVIRLPSRDIDVDKLRLVGAITIALFGMQVLGLPIPSWAPLVVFGIGFGLLLGQQLRGQFNN